MDLLKAAVHYFINPVARNLCAILSWLRHTINTQNFQDSRGINIPESYWIVAESGMKKFNGEMLSKLFAIQCLYKVKSFIGSIMSADEMVSILGKYILKACIGSILFY